MLDHKQKKMKAVAVLSGNEGVSGTVYFSQEGDGMFLCSRPGFMELRVLCIRVVLYRCFS